MVYHITFGEVFKYTFQLIVLWYAHFRLKIMHAHVNNYSKLAAPLVADDIFEIVMEVWSFFYIFWIHKHTWFWWVIIRGAESLLHLHLLQNAALLDSEIIYDRDFDYDYFGFKTLERSYLLKVNGVVVERPQHMLMRVAIGIHKHDIQAAIKTYHMMSQRWFTHASPTLFNAGTPRPQVSLTFTFDLLDRS